MKTILAFIMVVFTIFIGNLRAQSFDLISPPDSATVVIEGLSTNTINIHWNADTSLSGTVNYFWQAILPGGNFDSSLLSFPSNNLGVDTVFTPSIDDLANYLATSGLNIGDSISLSWSVLATNGTDSVRTHTPRNITLVRGVVVYPFNQLNPPNASNHLIAGSPFQNLDISWQSAGEGVQYRWELEGVPPFSPVQQIFSSRTLNNGADTFLSINYRFIEQLLAANAVQVGQTIPDDIPFFSSLRWKTYAIGGGDSAIAANATFDISLTRGVLDSAFALLSPSDNSILNVSGDPNTTVDIIWESADSIFLTSGITYEWLYDINAPGITSNSAGADTILTLTFGQIDSLLAANGVSYGDSLTTFWSVRATNGVDSLIADDIFTITLIRDGFFDFDLLSPLDSSKLVVGGLASTPVVIDWENAGAEIVNYNWMIDSLNGDFTNPILSINTSADSLLLTMGDLDALLASLGVNMQDSVTLKWTVTGNTAANYTVGAQDTFTIEIVRGTVFQNFSLLSPPDSSYFLIQGRATNTLQASWNASNTGSTYLWVANVIPDFANPPLSSLSNISGVDTTLTLTFDEIDFELQQLGLSNGQTLNLFWTVFAINGTDTIQSDDIYYVTLEKGNVFYDFSLLSPPDNTVLDIEGLPTNFATISWESSTSNVSYIWLADTATNFNNPLLSIPATNIGDTSITLDFATLDNVLDGFGVAVGQSLGLNWTVIAADAIDTVFSADTFGITLNRNGLLNPYSLLQPTNAASLTIEGNGNQTIDISWETAVNGATYTWLADPTTNFNSPLLSLASNNLGSDTVLTLDYTTLDNVLQNAGLSIGQSVTLNWTVRAIQAGDTLFAADTFSVQLTRGVVLNQFNLISPPNGGATIVIQGLGTNLAGIVWNSASTAGVTYNWKADTALNFTNPLLLLPSNNSGQDTVLNISYATIDNVLASLGVAVGSTATLNWTVTAFGLNDSINSVDTFSVTFRRGNLLADFNLQSPANASSLTLQGASTNLVDITWNRSVPGANYRWILDTLADMTTAHETLLSNNLGSDTVLSVPVGALDNYLAGIGVGLGQSKTVYWTVSAKIAQDSIFSLDTFSLTLTRGNVFGPFDLVSPNNNQLQLVRGLAEDLVIARWRSSGPGVNYIWQLDAPGGNFSNPIYQQSTGADTIVNVRFDVFEDLLIANGAIPNVPFAVRWRVLAYSGADTVVSNTFRVMNAVRSIVLRPFDLLTPADQTSLIVQGNAANQVRLSWEKSSKLSNTNQWQLDTLGGDFSSPLLTINAPSGGQDTAFFLSYNDLDAFLQNNGIGIGNTISLIWRVRASGGVVNRFSTDTFRLDLTRGVLMRSYNLQSPLNNANLIVQGNDTSEVNINWRSAGPAGISYEWVLDSVNGNFLPGLLSINAGTDTNITLTIDDLHTFLVSQGVPFQGFINTRWTVRAYFAGDTLWASAPFNLRLTRRTMIFDFDLLNPVDNSSLNLQGDGSQTVNINWQAGGDGAPEYRWLLDLPGGDFTNPLANIPSNNGGADTNLTLTFTQIDDLLIQNGVLIGDTIDLIWTVRVNAANEDRLATNTSFNLRIIRGTVLREFNLVSPVDNSVFSIVGSGTNTITINWESAGGNTVNYEWLASTLPGNFVNPTVRLNSANGGTSNFLVLTFQDIDALLTSLGVTDSIDLVWSVRAFNGADEVFANNAPFAIRLRKGNVLSPFNILTPASGTFAIVQGDGNQNVNITWETAGTGTYTYEWVLDLKTGNFSPPQLVVSAGNNNSLSLNFREINQELAALGMNVGDTLNAKWSVRATDGNDVILANNAFDIDFRRGVITRPFALTGPANNTSLSIPENSTDVLNISWQNADETNSTMDLNYEWILDLENGDFTNPLLRLASLNSGKANSLTLPYSQIHQLLINNGVGVGQSVDLKWTVRAFEGSLEEFPINDFNLSLTRIQLVGVEEAQKDVYLVAYPNPATNFLNLVIEGVELDVKQMDIFDMKGSQINLDVQSLNSNHLILNTSDLTTGIYFIRIRHPQFNVTKQFIVK